MKRGSLVIDLYGNKGIIVKIIQGYSDEDHGNIFVW